jgi:hypothetical protein
MEANITSRKTRRWIGLRVLTETVLLLGLNSAMSQEQAPKTGSGAQIVEQTSKQDEWQFAAAAPNPRALTETEPVLLLGQNAAMPREQASKTGSGAQTAEQISKSSPIQKLAKQDDWQFTIDVPGWLTFVDGTVGINGVTAPIHLDPSDLLNENTDFVVSLRGEVSKGRFGVLFELQALGLSNDLSGSGTVSKLHVSMQEYLGDMALRWRLIDSDQGSIKGSLDVLAGVRYTRLYQEYGITGSDTQIQTSSAQFADTASENLQQAIQDKLSGIGGKFPIAPVGGAVGERLRTEIQEILAQKGTLTKAQMTQKISSIMTRLLNLEVSRTDEWFDPYIGLRGRLDFKRGYYAQARADVGGFGVGSHLMWQGLAGFGRRFTPNIYAEFCYRALAFNCNNNGLLFDMITHGPELTVGIKF